MPRTYSATGGPVTATKLSESTLTEIGRLVRAFAEIEDLITLYICNLAELSESRASILLGRTAITRRLAMAAYLAKTTGPEITALHAQLFNAGFEECLLCRNTVAHGVLVGLTDENRFAFLTDKTEDPLGDSAIRIVISYTHEDIKIYADLAESAIPIITYNLKLETLRDRRLQQSLLPHRKGRIPKSGKGSQKPPPPPSPAKR